MEMNKETVDAIIENSFEKQAEELFGSVPETKVELADEEQANFEESEKPHVEYLTKEDVMEKYPLMEEKVFSNPIDSPEVVEMTEKEAILHDFKNFGNRHTDYKEVVDYSIPEMPTSPQPNQEQSRHDKINEPANKPLIDPEKIRERIDSLQKSEATQEELDTMILSERANAMIEYIKNRMAGEKRADRMKQATIAITMILKAKTEALNAMRAGRI